MYQDEISGLRGALFTLLEKRTILQKETVETEEGIITCRASINAFSQAQKKYDDAQITTKKKTKQPPKAVS